MEKYYRMNIAGCTPDPCIGKSTYYKETLLLTAS